MPTDPFGSLGSAIAGAVADTLTAAMLSLWNAGLWVLRSVLGLEDSILTPDLGEQGPVGELYATTFWIALALAGILVLVQIGVALGKRDGRSIGRLLVGAAQFGFVWFAWIGYAIALVAACSGLTKALMASLLHVYSWSEWQPWEPFTTSDVTNSTVAVILGIMGLLLWLAAIAHALVLLARTASLLVLAAATPISAAGLVADFGRSWFWKSFRWFHAAALTPPLMVLGLGIGVKVTTGVAVGGETDLLKSVGTAFVGVILICVSAFSPLALYRLFAFTDPGSTSGAALRAGITASGGIGGILGGGQGANSSATVPDGMGHTSGENSAASTTLTRFSAGLGLAGQALSSSMNVMAGLGGTGAAMGADLTNQMGVGHNTFPPGYSGRAMRAANAQSGDSISSPGFEQDWSGSPDEAQRFDASDPAGDVSWDGPHESLAPDASSSAGQARVPIVGPAAEGSGPGSAGTAAATSSEVAAAAEVAAL